MVTRADLLECLEDGEATALDIADTVDADGCAVSMALLRVFRRVWSADAGAAAASAGFTCTGSRAAEQNGSPICESS